MKRRLHPYLANLEKTYELKSNPVRAEEMSRYMKNHFPFLGIPSPQRKEIFKKNISGTRPAQLQRFAGYCKKLLYTTRKGIPLLCH